tara:strand:- start:2312 stop:3067 length:756 start_codon:yes stop_codon:yes gene_type:complete
MSQEKGAFEFKEVAEAIDEIGQEKISISKKEYEELKKYENVIKCIKGENGGKCIISDFLPIDNIPENIRSKLSILNEIINEKFPVDLFIPFKNNDPCNNQSLGNQIPKALKEYISTQKELSNLLKFQKMKCCGYPDEKVDIKIDDTLIDTPFLWEWKSMYSNDGKGVRIVISKFPNKRIPATFDDCKKYHLWICLEYQKSQDHENKKTKITISKMNIHCISPNTTLNTKFELSTTADLIKKQINDGNIMLV